MTKSSRSCLLGRYLDAFPRGHLQDLLDVNALCAGSIAGITTSAAAMAPYGAAVHAACRYNALTKNPTAQATCGGIVSARICVDIMLHFMVYQVWTRIFCCLAGKAELVSVHRGDQISTSGASGVGFR